MAASWQSQQQLLTATAPSPQAYHDNAHPYSVWIFVGIALGSTVAAFLLFMLVQIIGKVYARWARGSPFMRQRLPWAVPPEEEPRGLHLVVSQLPQPRETPEQARRQLARRPALVLNPGKEGHLVHGRVDSATMASAQLAGPAANKAGDAGDDEAGNPGSSQAGNACSSEAGNPGSSDAGQAPTDKAEPPRFAYFREGVPGWFQIDVWMRSRSHTPSPARSPGDTPTRGRPPLPSVITSTLARLSGSLLRRSAPGPVASSSAAAARSSAVMPEGQPEQISQPDAASQAELEHSASQTEFGSKVVSEIQPEPEA